MAQLDGFNRYGETNTPRTPTTLTIEQLLRGGDQRWSPYSSPTCARDLDPEDIDRDFQQKKPSVLAKVKEKARKWRRTLSKNKHSEGDNTTPSWGVSLEDEEDEDEDPEYLGAPMYESELAPDGYKENARQHPRAIPVISEKHLLPSKTGVERGNEKLQSPTKTIAETVTDKLAPAYATVSEATHSVVSKIQSLTISAPSAPPGSDDQKHANDQELDNKDKHKTDEKHTPKTNTSSPDQKIWDRGVSVKEYIMHKLEPGQDERALSQVISEAMSPRTTPGDVVGVMEKVREAVNSLLWSEKPTSAQPPITHSAINPSPHNIPISTTNPHEDVQEEHQHQGRILQAN